MKIPQILFATLSTIGSLASLQAADLNQPGQITLNPTAGPVILTLQGPGYNNATSGNFGLTLSYHDYSEINDVATGIFRLYRPQSQYQWQLSTDTGSDRLAMQLDNHHILKLTDPSDPTNPNKSIELRPGPDDDYDRGIFINGQRVLTANQVAYFSGQEVGGFWAYQNYLWGDSVAGVNTTNGSASFANGGVIIDPDGNVIVNSLAAALPSFLVDITGFKLRSSTLATVSIDYDTRTLYDTNGSLAVMNWGRSNGSAVFAGRVGVGSGNVNTSPISTLQVGGTSGSNRISLSGGTTGANYGIDWLFNGTGKFGSINMDYDTRASKGLRIASNYGISFFTADANGGNGTAKAYIDSAGNTGIGTITPSEKLHVVGNIRATGIIRCAAGGDISMGAFTAAP